MSGERKQENMLWRGDIDFSGYVVDFAVLDSETITSPKEIEAHVINLDGIAVSVTEFKKLFYPDGNTFQLNIAEQDSKNVSMRGREVKGVPFKLVKAITRFYGDDLGVELNCMDPCTTTEITSQITGYKSLMDFCEVNCHLSWTQIIEALYNKYPDGKHEQLKKDVHNLRLSVRFHNANKQIRDVMVTFNFEVDFDGATLDEELEITDVINAVSAQTNTGALSTTTKDIEFKYMAQFDTMTTVHGTTYLRDDTNDGSLNSTLSLTSANTQINVPTGLSLNDNIYIALDSSMSANDLTNFTTLAKKVNKTDNAKMNKNTYISVTITAADGTPYSGNVAEILFPNTSEYNSTAGGYNYITKNTKPSAALPLTNTITGFPNAILIAVVWTTNTRPSSHQVSSVGSGSLGSGSAKLTFLEI